jgi:ABC-2 type transport system permease protein
MKKYWISFKLALLSLLEYRFDLLMHSFRYATTILLLLMLWLAIARSNPESAINTTQLTQYYLIAAIIYGLSNFHTDRMERDIQLGHLSQFLVKPFSPFWHYGLHHWSQIVLELLIKSTLLLPFFFLTAGGEMISLPQLLLFLAFLPMIYLTMYSLYFMVSALAFWFQAIDSIRMSVMFTFRFLSGIFVPLSFFPEWWQSLAWWLPFPQVAFTPIQVMTGELSLTQGLQGLFILVGWSVLIQLCSRLIWHQATHAYEANGL